jgi:hypothetical protein
MQVFLACPVMLYATLAANDNKRADFVSGDRCGWRITRDAVPLGEGARGKCRCPHRLRRNGWSPGFAGDTYMDPGKTLRADYRRQRRRLPHKVTAEMPWPIKAIQIDGGSEFIAEFEKASQDKKNRPLCPAATLAKTQRSRRAMQWRMALRILCNRRPPGQHPRNRRTRRHLPAPLQPSPPARSPRRASPQTSISKSAETG